MRERLAKMTFELCSIPSVTGDEKALCDFLQPWAERHFPGQVRRFNHTLVAGSLSDPRPTVALFGHIDTVPAHPKDSGPRLEADRVVGLGSSDMKSGDAVMMALVEDLNRSALPYNLLVVFYEREEGPYDKNGLGPVLAAMPELKGVSLAFALESTDNEVHVGCVGSMHARVTFRGKSAHSARPWTGENAIHKAAPLLAELGARPRTLVEVDGFEFFEVISATLAKGGRAANVVPESFELNLNYRFAPGKGVDEAEAELRALVGGRADTEIVDRSPAGRVCTGNPLLKRFFKLTGAHALPKQAWTDVGRLSAHGIDAVNFGPGLTSQAHQQGEHVPKDALVLAYQRMRAFLEDRAAG
jgi:succinyl-diaminopimelate desuccinylase